VLERQWALQEEQDVQLRMLNMVHSLQFERLKRRLGEWRLLFDDDLLMGAWLLATYQYPSLELSSLRTQISDLHAFASDRMDHSWHPYEKVHHLSYLLFVQQKFRGNKEEFHNINNSLINRVLETRRGTPISLCIVYMLIAQRMGMPVFGVNFPNLFLLTYKTANTQFYINAFNNGLILQKADVENYLSALAVPTMDYFYQPCSHVDIMKRVVRNMATAFDQENKGEKTAEMQELLDVLSLNEIGPEFE
jgi:regulator of sirC expression with transglutaminase-like and TPR domain